MRLSLVALFLLLTPLPLSAVERCEGDRLALESLYAVREAMLASSTDGWSGRTIDVTSAIDRIIDRLREPLISGGYRWVRWVEPDSGGPVRRYERLVSAVHPDLQPFEAREHHPYAVRIAVPRKRSLFRGNNAVWVGDVEIRHKADGEHQVRRVTIDRWLAPNSMKTIELGAIADDAIVTVEAATRRRTRDEALVEIQFIQAVAEDDPANPQAATIRLLRQMRNGVTPVELDAAIARLEHLVLPASKLPPLATIATKIEQARRLIASDDEEERQKGSRMLDEAVRLLRQD